MVSAAENTRMFAFYGVLYPNKLRKVIKFCNCWYCWFFDAILTNMQNTITLLFVALLAGCATTVTPPAAEYRQPWTVYKTRADIVNPNAVAADANK
jgi:hypothetical protein